MTEDSFKDKNILYLWKMIQLPHNAQKYQNKGCFDHFIKKIANHFNILSYPVQICNYLSYRISNYNEIYFNFTRAGLKRI